MNWPLAIVALLLLTASQEWFLESHRRRYGLWRSTRERRFWATPEERRLMWRAYMQRNRDPVIERVRLFSLAVIAFCFVALLVSVLKSG